MTDQLITAEGSSENCLRRPTTFPKICLFPQRLLALDLEMLLNDSTLAVFAFANFRLDVFAQLLASKHIIKSHTFGGLKIFMECLSGDELHSRKVADLFILPNTVCAYDLRVSRRRLSPPVPSIQSSGESGHTIKMAET